MSAYTFKIRGDCGGSISGLDCCCYNSHVLRNYDAYIIDFSGLTFIHPSGIVATLCLIERLLEYGKPTKVILPKNPAINYYFSKIHMLDALKSLTKTATMPMQLGDRMARLTPIIPVASFYNESEVEMIAQNIEATMSHQGYTNLMWACHTIVAELAANVVQHSGGSRGWVLVQKYNYSGGHIIEIAVGDSGIGMRRSLSRNPLVASTIHDDKDAVKRAVSESVSRYTDPLRGNGLFYVCSEILATDRKLSIRSGTACLVVHDDGRQIVYNRLPMVGVLAEARIPC